MLNIAFLGIRNNGFRRWSDILKWKEHKEDAVNDRTTQRDALNGEDLIVLGKTINHIMEALPPDD